MKVDGFEGGMIRCEGQTYINELELGFIKSVFRKKHNKQETLISKSSHYFIHEINYYNLTHLYTLVS
jgi:hypothetical protein